MDSDASVAKPGIARPWYVSTIEHRQDEVADSNSA
jgi:hypothetical protein